MQKIRKGDKVVVLAGKDKGRSGEVLSVAPKDGKPTRVGFKFVGTGDARRKVRVAKRSGVEIDG